MLPEKPEKPYIAGGSVSDNQAFVGRADVLREVLNVLRDPHQNAIVLFGQRRIGKTSVLRELEAKLPTDGYCPIFFDLQDKAQWPLERVLRTLAKEISYVLQPKDWQAPDLGADPETTFREVWLPKMLDTLPTETSLVLLFDEFDVLADPKDEQASTTFFPYLRHLLTIDLQRLNFVFVIGRKIDELNMLALSALKGIDTYRVSLLNKEDTIQLIRLSEVNQTLNWTSEAIDKIWQQTNGHPYLTQSLCAFVWDNIYDQAHDQLPIATMEDIEMALPNVLKKSLRFYERVLELDAENSEAKNGLQTIWQQRGDHAYEKGDLDNALEAYRKADSDDKVTEIEKKIRTQTHLPEWYQPAQFALQQGDKQKAKTFFAKIIAIDPEYKEVSRYLHFAITNVDPNDSINVIQKLKKSNRKWLLVFTAMTIFFVGMVSTGAICFTTYP